MAAIVTDCPSCGRKIKIPDELQGKQVKCPSCSTTFQTAEEGPVDAVAAASPAARPEAKALIDGEGDSQSVKRTKFCFECGEKIREGASVCPHCGVEQPRSKARRDDLDSEIRRGASNKVAAGICGILLGSLGIHKFILGLTTPGIIMLLVSLLTCGAGLTVMWVIGLIEGIIYLTKSDEEFYETYIVGKKGWF
jgi:predicted Zn finger-like uncharacterized protein